MKCYAIDASVVAKWHFPEGLSEVALSLLERTTAAEVRLVAPVLLLYELGSIIVKKLRIGQVRPDDAEIIIASLATAPIKLVSAEELLPRALALSMAIRASFYDALYLAVAEECDGKLLTADVSLVNQARNSGLSHRITSLGELDSDL